MWFNQKTSIASPEISNWVLVLAALTAIAMAFAAFIFQNKSVLARLARYGALWGCASRACLAKFHRTA